MQQHDSRYRWGLVSAVCAHLMWGFFPLYWKLLQNISAPALVAHRVLWAFLFLAITVPILIRTGNEIAWADLKQRLATRKLWLTYALAGVLVGFNWVAFILAVTSGQILQASLGYYINPLFSILLGVVVLRERLLGIQWLAVLVAAIGVTIITVRGGGLPWLSLMMAGSFSLYGLVKKKAPLPSLSGLLMECTVLLAPAVFWLAVMSPSEGKTNMPADTAQWLLVMGGGLLTIMPLALFATASKRVPLSTLGVLQYIGPTLQFLTAVLINGEPFDRGRLAGFVCVWLGSLLYLAALAHRRTIKPNKTLVADATVVR